MAKGAAAALADAFTAVIHTPDAPEHGRVGQRISMHKNNVPWPASDDRSRIFDPEELAADPRR